jgi:hypothetical protein
MYLLWFCLLQNTCFSILPHFLPNFPECFALHTLTPVYGALMITKPILPACRCLLKFHTSILCTLLHRHSRKLLGCILCSTWYATNGMVYLNGMCVLESQLLCSPDLELLNPLNAELNSICHLLALLGAHHIFHFGRIRVKWHPQKRQIHSAMFHNLLTILASP